MIEDGKVQPGTPPAGTPPVPGRKGRKAKPTFCVLKLVMDKKPYTWQEVDTGVEIKKPQQMIKWMQNVHKMQGKFRLVKTIVEKVSRVEEVVIVS